MYYYVDEKKKTSVKEEEHTPKECHRIAELNELESNCVARCYSELCRPVFLFLVLCVVKDEYIIFIHEVVNIFKCTHSTRAYFNRWKWMRVFFFCCFVLLSVWFGFSGTSRYNAVYFLRFTRFPFLRPETELKRMGLCCCRCRRYRCRWLCF